MAYDAENPKRTRPDALDYWTKKSEIDQLVANQDAVYDDFDAGHSTSTGAHTADDIGDVVDGWLDTGWSNVNLTNSVDDNGVRNITTGLTSRTDPATLTPATAADTLPKLSSDIWGGIAYCKGATASGGEAEGVLEFTTSGSNTARTRLIRRTTGSGAADFTPKSVGTQKVGFRIGAYVGIAGKSEQPAVTQRNQIVAVGAPVARNHIDRSWQNAAAIKAALEARHDGSFLPETIAWEEMYGGRFIPYGTATITRSNQFTTSYLGAHGGNQMCIIPWACLIGGAEHSIMPGWDDTGMYLVHWIAPGLSSVGTDTIYAGGTVFRNEAAPAASFTGSFDGAYTVSQGDATDLDIYSTKLGKNDEILDKLWRARHRMNGLHAWSLDEFTGYSVIENNTAVTISGTIGVVTTETLEAWPATDPIYFVSLVGAAGSGIAAITIGGDETNSKVYIRRVTAGSSNSFTLRVIRISRL